MSSILIRRLPFPPLLGSGNRTCYGLFGDTGRDSRFSVLNAKQIITMKTTDVAAFRSDGSVNVLQSLRTWLQSENKKGSSVMDERVTNAQLVGALLINVSLVLFCLSPFSVFFFIAYAVLLLLGSKLMQGKIIGKGGKK